ncbi:MAG TPA: hypothetical protein DEP05_02225 [Betaproteobacteria bacterium]|nr:hypothetical protein [Betaproteobacteria bacterium]
MCVVMITAMLGACATAPGAKFSGIATPVKNRGDVYLYRKAAIFAFSQAFEVTLDGHKVGKHLQCLLSALAASSRKIRS